MGGQTAHTALVAPELQSWISVKVWGRSAFLKERRKGREERLLASGPAVIKTEPKSKPDAKPKAKPKGGAKGKLTHATEG